MASNPAPKRHLPMEGAYNIRDIGGYPIESGGNTRWKTFLRSDSMHRLTSDDQANLLAYGVRTAIDLRTTDAAAELPNVFEDSAEVSYVRYNILGDEPTPESEIVESGVPADRIRRAYTHWLDTRQGAFQQTLALLADPAARPAVFHCAGGKDRTGLISALLLDIAGVARETIAEDYALTSHYLLQRTLDGHEIDGQDDITTWQQYQAHYCPPEGMMKTLEHLDARYGGVSGYMQAIGLSGGQIESLRNALVE